MANLASELQYVSDKDFKEIHLTSTEISKLISGLIKTL